MSNDNAGTMVASTFDFKSVPELAQWQQELEAKYPGRSYAVLHLTSVSLMVSDVRAYAFAEIAGLPQQDIAEQCLACQAALVKAMQSLGIAQEDFLKSGQLLFRALMLHAQPEPGAGLN